MKPFFQGKIDVFCAIYAVLNALRVTHHIRTLQARDIFHDTLMGIAQDAKTFRAVLEQQTDYIGLVDAMLNVQGRKFPLHIEKPFEKSTNDNAPSSEAVFESIKSWLAPNAFQGGSIFQHVPERVVIFRFLRYLMPDAQPVNRHWTTAYIMKGEELEFFDCSLEESAIYSLDKFSFVTRTEHINSRCLCCVEPHSIRFLAPRK